MPGPEKPTKISRSRTPSNTSHSSVSLNNVNLTTWALVTFGLVASVASAEENALPTSTVALKQRDPCDRGRREFYTCFDEQKPEVSFNQKMDNCRDHLRYLRYEDDNGKTLMEVGPPLWDANEPCNYKETQKNYEEENNNQPSTSFIPKGR